MSEEDIMIDACCYSKKKRVSIGFGVGVTSNDDSISEDQIYEGLGDSFWENYQEFEPGVSEAYSIVRNASDKDDDCDDLLAALYRVFGDFEIEFEVNGEKIELEFDVDVNSIMYSMLPDVFVDDDS